MDRSIAFVPGHVSGFFEICDASDDPLKVGSRNCGLCISKGVRTSVEVQKNDTSEIEVFINGEIREAKTTKKVVENLLQKDEDEFFVKVSHEVQSPIGVGYGMSGAGALGTSLTLAEVLDLDMDSDGIVGVAHKAEVECKSGLGDVFPQKLGGMALGVEPGSPPFGELEKLGLDKDVELIIGTLGSVSTSDILNSSDLRKNSRTYGEKAFDNFASDKNLRNFMKVSKSFDEDLGVFVEDFIDILKYLNSKSPYGSAVALLGRSIFSPVHESQVEEVKGYFEEYFDANQIINPNIDFHGARIVD